MKNFEFDPNAYSRDEYLIGGISTYVYNASQLTPYINLINEKFNKHSGITDSKQLEEVPVKIVYLVHQRGGDYTYTESAAYTVLKQYYKKASSLDVPLVCVTFDNRNHGARLVQEVKNRGWKSNDTHGADLVSIVEGNVIDLKLVMDYLPAYLNLEAKLAPELKKAHQTVIKYRNGVCGYSLGGHTVIRYALKYPESIEFINPNIGCADMTSLLITRLLQVDKESPAFDKKWFYSTYDELKLTEHQSSVQYPEYLHRIVAAEDISIFENYPFSLVKMFAAFGADDLLVPARLSKLWTDMYKNSNPATEVFVQPEVGHDVTPEMVDKFTSWLARNY